MNRNGQWAFATVLGGGLLALCMWQFDVAGQASSRSSADTNTTTSGLQQAGVGVDRALDMKQEAFKFIDERQRATAVIVDTLFSIPELGFQEFETVKYITEILDKEGFRIEREQAGVPTAFTATWGSGKPEIGIMADIDALPSMSQKPGVAYHDPMIPGAPGHGEGHNAGSAVTITAALAAKRLMMRHKLPGTIRVMPGVADEMGGIRGYLFQRGVYDGLDVLLVAHQGNTLGSSWGAFGTGYLSTQFTFRGTSGHAAAYFWRTRSALDAVELMNVGWNLRREHLPLSQRSHYVITNGGEYPNVVPPEASVWYFFDESEPEDVRALHRTGQEIAKAAAAMTGTTVEERILGGSWHRNPNESLAKLLHANGRLVGMPKWSDEDVAFAKAVQKEMGMPEVGLNTSVRDEAQQSNPTRTGGPPSDLGDLTWNLPVGNLTYPAGYIPGIIVHHWSATLSMATPIAHKGATVGAKALTGAIVDLLLNPQHVRDAQATFAKQTAGRKWESLLPSDYKPPIDWNRETMRRYGSLLKEYRYDASRYGSYLEQLGIKYPTLRSSKSARSQ